MFFSMSKTLFIISVNINLINSNSYQINYFLFFYKLSFFCQQTSSTKVVIVGAGISGYSAAAKLMENGVDDIIVLEAENRIGGRIYSYQLDENKFIDLGAQWVHGQKNNVIYEMLADKFNFGSSKYDVTDKEFRVSTGEVLNQESANRLFEKLYEIADDSESLAEQELNDIGSYLNQMFNILSVANFQGNFSDITDEMKQELKQLVHKSIAGYYASRTSFDVSAKLSGTLYGKTEGDEFNTWRTDGFKTVFEFINVNG
jgi:spermine oxidase